MTQKSPRKTTSPTRRRRRASVKQLTVCGGFKDQLNNLMKIIDGTRPWYIRCIKPNDKNVPNKLVSERLLQQLRYGGVLEAVRVSRAGYPYRIEHLDFVNKFGSMVSGVQNLKKNNSEKCQTIIDGTKLNERDCQVGLTKVFLRQDAYDRIEAWRWKRMNLAAVIVQSRARGHTQVKIYKAKLATLYRAVVMIKMWLRRRHLKFVRQKAAIRTINRFCRRDFQGFLARVQAVICIQCFFRILLAKRIQKIRIIAHYQAIEDGQTRLSILQQYHDDRFEYNGHKFSDLNDEQKNRFLDYNISREVLSPKSGVSNDEFEENIHIIFQRLQQGKVLSNADMYWNRSKYPGVKFANELIELFKDKEKNYLGTKTYSSKSRSVLPEFCAIINAILYDEYGPAFRFQFKYICLPIANANKEKVIAFMNYYMAIINNAEPHQIETPNKQTYNKCSKFWGSILMDWKNRSETNTRSRQRLKWIEIIKISRASPNFIKGAQTLYNGLAKGVKQNTTNEAIKTRLQRINDFYNNKEHFTNQYRIEWNEP